MSPNQLASPAAQAPVVLRIIITDDEPLARLRLTQLCEDLHSECPNSVVAQYSQGSALINALPHWERDIAPDVVLLDINMPGLNGVEIAAFLKQHAPTVAVVFVTAEPEHALEAFELAAVDYVLKPVRPTRLLAALQKVQHHKALRLRSISAVNTTDLLAAEPQITVHIVHAQHLAPIAIPISQVLYFKAEHKTTLVRTANTAYISSLSLGELEKWLLANGQAFVRIHRNALLSRSAVGQLTMQSGDCSVQVLGVVGQTEYLQVSRRMLAGLREIVS